MRGSVAFGHLLWRVTSEARQWIRCARFDVLNLTEGARLWATPRRCGPCASCKHVNLPPSCSRACRWLTKMLSPCGRRSCNSTIEAGCTRGVVVPVCAKFAAVCRSRAVSQTDADAVATKRGLAGVCGFLHGHFIEAGRLRQVFAVCQFLDLDSRLRCSSCLIQIKPFLKLI